MSRVQVEANRCDEPGCGHTWLGEAPKRCAKCKSRNWDKAGVRPERIVEAGKVRHKGKVQEVIEAVKEVSRRPVSARKANRAVEQVLQGTTYDLVELKQLATPKEATGCRCSGWAFCRQCKFGMCRHSNNAAICTLPECVALRAKGSF